VPDLLWDEVRAWFEPDGSLVDAYVFDTTVADWQDFLDLVRSSGWWFSYREDGQAKQLPDRAEEVFGRDDQAAVLLQIRPVPEVLINVHFFTSDEIEIDFAPEELQGQERIDVFCRVLRAIGRRLGKPVVVTPESSPGLPWATYDLDTDRVMVGSA
jgi:hypothetical protein